MTPRRAMEINNPIEKRAEYIPAFRGVSITSCPPTYPIIRGIEARWHGLKRMLITPHKKHPTAAIKGPPVIHSFTVMKKDSNIS
jgi:hypothetical protein